MNLIISGERSAYQILLVKYEKYAKILSHTFLSAFPKKHLGFSFEDLVNIALNAVVLALQNYNPEYGAPFYPYWKEVASKEMAHFIEDNSYHSGAKMFAGALSLDSFIDNSEKDTTIGDIVSSKDGDIRGELYLDDTSFMISEIIKKYSEEDQKILYLYVIGYSYEEISHNLNVPVTRIYSSMRRIRSSIKKTLSK